MPYAQKNYTQNYGSTDYTIAQAGSLITAFSNVLQQMGFTYEPSTINSLLTNAGLDPAKGLYWSAISIVEPSVQADQEGHSLAVMTYESKLTGGTARAYAAVHNFEDGTIIDSYDGEIKPWSIYDPNPTFIGYTIWQGPIEVTPLVAAPVVEEAPELPTYEVLTDLEGYTTDTFDGEPVVTFKAGTYYLSVQTETAVALSTELDGKTTYWVNPAKNLKPAPSLAPAPAIDLHDETVNTTEGIYAAEPEEDTKVDVKVIPSNPDKWQHTWVGNLGTVDYIALRDTLVADQAGKQPNRLLEHDTLVPVAGWFTGPDGKRYARTPKSEEANNWYGVPEDALHRVRSEAEIDAVLGNADEDLSEYKAGLTLHGNRDKARKIGGTIEGKLLGLFKHKQKV